MYVEYCTYNYMYKNRRTGGAHLLQQKASSTPCHTAILTPDTYDAASCIVSGNMKGI